MGPTRVSRAVAARSALFGAAHWGRKGVVELLLAKGAEVNAKDNKGVTPLHEAMIEGRNEVAELLRQYGGHE